MVKGQRIPTALGWLLGCCVAFLALVAGAVVDSFIDRAMPQSAPARTWGWCMAALSWLAENAPWISVAILAIGLFCAFMVWRTSRHAPAAQAAAPVAPVFTARALRCGRPLLTHPPLADGKRGEIGFSFTIYNAHPRPVSLREEHGPFSYGILICPIRVQGLPASVNAYESVEVVLWLPNAGKVGEQVQADYERGEIDTLNMEGLRIYASCEGVSEIVETPQGAFANRKGWSTVQVVFGRTANT